VDIVTTLNKLGTVMTRANEFIDANAPQMLPHNKTKLIDICTISLMQYEDHVFHWDQLKNIVTELVEMKIHGKPQWFLDITHSTGERLVINGIHGQQIIIPVETCMMITQLAAH
jgi:hypothetical protein